MKNLYAFYDSVSGLCGQVFEAENDMVMRRSAIRALASFSPEIARDTIVLQLGSVRNDDGVLPALEPCVPARIALAGSSPDVEQARIELLAEAQRYSPFAGGDANAE